MDDNLSGQATERSQFKALWDFVFLSGGETIGKVAGFVAFAYLARTLDSDSYGAAELAMAMLAIFGLIVNFGFGPIGGNITGNYTEILIADGVIRKARPDLTLDLCGIAKGFALDRMVEALDGLGL